MMDRREFFKKLCALSGTLLLPLGCSQDNTTTAVDLGDAPTGTISTFSKQAFIDAIDSVFSVSHDSSGVVDLQLSYVIDEMLIDEAEQFSISLSGPEAPVLEEDSYAIYNDRFGNIELYLQPGASSNGQQHYVAMFSLLHA